MPGGGSEGRPYVDETLLAIVLVLYLLCAWAMDAVGIHAVFGGFLLGTAMPRGRLTAAIREKLEPVTVVVDLWRQRELAVEFAPDVEPVAPPDLRHDRLDSRPRPAGRRILAA